LLILKHHKVIPKTERGKGRSKKGGNDGYEEQGMKRKGKETE